MQAGQSVKQPDLPAITEPDPVVLVAGASGGFGTRMPRKERMSRPPKKSLAIELSERFAADKLKEQRAIDDRQAGLSAVLWGAADHHMLSVEDWSAACYLEMGMIGPTATFDALSRLTLHCRYEVPAKRRGEPMQVDILIERPRDLDGERDELGWVNYRKRVLSLFMTDADAIAFLSTALSAGRIRTLELEVVTIDRRPSVRWARFGTMPELAV